MFDLTDDLTQNQFQDLITWLWVSKAPVTRANVKAWRKLRGMDISD